MCQKPQNLLRYYAESPSMKILSACNHALIHLDDEISLLNEICRIIIEIGGYRFAWVGYAKDDENKTVQPIAQERSVGYLED